MITPAALAALSILLILVIKHLRKLPRSGGSHAVRIVLCRQDSDGYLHLFTKGTSMKKISSSVLHFLISVAALTAAGLSATVDGAISIVSSDPSVLLVTPQADGAFLVEVTGVGLANLTASGDADLGDGIRTISQVFEFQVYDGATEADHFDLSITEVTHATAVAEAADTGDGAEPAATS
jgi:hypothetical protein